MDLTALKAFTEVAASGSFSRASENLFLTQPAVSKRIASLEQELGIRLFDRLGRNIILTEAGQQLLPVARDMLNRAEDMRRLATSLDDRISGRLLLGTSHHIGLHRLPTVLKAYRQAYPDVELDIRFMDSEAACLQVETGELDIAVVTLPQHPSDKLVLQPIWHDPLVFAVSPDHPLNSNANGSKGVKLKPAQLAEHPAVIPGVGTYTREILESALLQKQLTVSVSMSTNYLETLKMLASIGLGWTLLPESMLDDDLVQLSISGLDLSRELGIVTHRGRTLTNAAKQFVIFLQQSAR